MFRDSKLNIHLLIVPKRSLFHFLSVRDHRRNERRLDRWWERVGEGKLSEGSRNMDKLGGMPRMWNGS